MFYDEIDFGPGVGAVVAEGAAPRESGHDLLDAIALPRMTTKRMTHHLL